MKQVTEKLEWEDLMFGNGSSVWKKNGRASLLRTNGDLIQ